MNIPCAFNISCFKAFEGEFHATFVGWFVGRFCADFNGTLKATVQGTIDATFTGTLQCQFTGQLDGEDFNGIINQYGTFHLVGSVGGKLDGVLVGNICGNLNGYISGRVDGTLFGEFIGTVDGVPTDPDYPVNNTSAELPDLNTGFPPFTFPDLTFPPTNIPPNGPTNGTDNPVPPEVLVQFQNNEQSYTLDCGLPLGEYTATVPAGYFTALTQSSADASALAFAQELAALYCSTGTPPTIYQNTRRECTVSCPSGASNTFTVPDRSFSGTSQAIADGNANSFACVMAAILCPPTTPGTPLPPGGIPPGGGFPPGFPPIPEPTSPPPYATAFTNSDQTSTVPCPNGGTFSYTTKSGQFFANNGATANAMALSYALDQAMTLRFCLLAFTDITQAEQVQAFRIALNDSDGFYLSLQHTGANSLFANPFTFTAVGAPPTSPPATLPVLTQIEQNLWSIYLLNLPASTPGEYATVFTISQDRPAYRIRHVRSISWFVGEISSSSPLTDAEVDNDYSYQLQTAFMLAPFTWEVTSLLDPLPTGLSLNPTTGLITGVATTEGTSTINVQVTDAAGVIVDKDFDIDVIAACITSPRILPNATKDAPYSQQLTQTGLSMPPFTWTLRSGTLPPGITLSTSGLLSGTPTTQASYDFIVEVEDSEANVCSKHFFLTVADSSSSCGWWQEMIWDQPYTGGGIPAGTSSFVPDPFVDGMGSFSLSVQQPQDPGWLFPEQLQVIGNYSYTGSAAVLKITVDVTVCNGIVNSSDGIQVQFKRDNVSRLNEQIQAVGTYEYLVAVDEEAAPINYKLDINLYPNSTAIAGDIQCTVTLASYKASSSSAQWVNDGSNPQFRFVPVAMNPASTFTVLSSADYTWGLGSVFHAAIWAVPPTITLDGVPLTLSMVGPNWVCDMTSFSTTACVPRVFQISGATTFDPTGLGAFHIIGPN